MILRRLKQSDRLLIPKNMESSSVCDDISEGDCQASSDDRVNRSNTDVECSTPGGDSLDYSRTISEISTYSEPSSSDEPLHLGWPISKLAGRASPVLGKVRGKQPSDVLDMKSGGDEVSGSGQVLFGHNEENQDGLFFSELS